MAERIVYRSVERLSAKVGVPPLEAFETAVGHVVPSMEVKSKRVGGSTYQVPIEVKKGRSVSLAIRWMVGFARKKSGCRVVEALSQELIDSFNKTGTSVKKRDDTHRMAEANKAFAHFRW